MSDQQKSSKEKYIGWLGIRCPPAFNAALKEAAAKHGVSASDYVRAAVEKEIANDERQAA